MEGLSPGSGSLKPRTYIRGERGRRKTGRQDWTQEGLVASATGPFVLLHVPESHPFRGERSQRLVSIPLLRHFCNRTTIPFYVSDLVFVGLVK